MVANATALFFTIPSYMYISFHSGDDISSGLSEHSSERLQQWSAPSSKAMSVAIPTKGAVVTKGCDQGDEDSDLLTPSASESTLVNGKPITSQNLSRSDFVDSKTELQEVGVRVTVNMHRLSNA